MSENITDRVSQVFQLPYVPYKYQDEIIDQAVVHKQSLLRLPVGTGKSIIALVLALFSSIEEDVEQILILCPPVLIPQWFRIIQQTSGVPSVVMYRGSPKQRKRMMLNESVVIMSFQIFKIDFDKIYNITKNRKVFVIADEVSLKSISTQIYKKFRKFVYQKVRPMTEADIVQRFTLLNATPISNILQSYPWIKILTPDVYSTERQFRSTHVKDEDFFGNPTTFKNLDLLEDNFALRAYHVNAEDVLELPDIVYTPIHYELSDKHYKLYHDLRNRKFNALPTQITALEASGLFNALQKCVTNPEEFGYSPRNPPLLELIDEQLEEIGDDKIILFANYRATNAKLLKHLGDTAVGLWGGVSNVDKEKGLDQFSHEINRVVANPRSGGVGLNLQHANRIIFVETPLNPSEFKQSVGRIYRQRQNKRCFVNILLAQNTIQEKLYYRLIAKDTTLNEVIKSKVLLKELLF